MSAIKVNRLENTSTADGGIDINTSGNVGIGTSSPSTKLHIASTAAGGDVFITNASGQNCLLEIAGNGNTIGSGSALYGQDASNNVFAGMARGAHPVLFGTNNTERLRIDSSGRLLVGTTTEGASNADNLTIADSGDCGITLRSGAANQAAVFFSDATSGAGEYDGFITYDQSNGAMRFGTTQSERLRIDSSGNVGIGTSSPNSFTNYKVLTIQGTDASGIDLEKGDGTIQGRFFGDATGVQIGAPAGSVRFETANTERMRIDSSGHFMLGTTVATNYSQASGNGNLAYRKDNGSDGGSLILASDADNNWSACYMNKFNWNNTKDGRYINFYKNASSLASIELSSAGLIDYNTGSDYRLKENVITMTNGITRLKQLQPKQFNMIDDPNNLVCDGFLAHEAQTVVPQAVCGTHNAVKTDENGNEVPDYQGMDYGKLTPLLTAALQEAIAKIETLETKVAALEGA